MNVTRTELLSLLDEPDKAKSIRSLQKMLLDERIDMSDADIKRTLFQLLPVFFGYCYVNGEKGTAERFITLLIEKIDISDEYLQSLLKKWRSFMLKNKASYFRGSSEDEEEVNGVATLYKFSENLGYEDLDFFIDVCKYLKYKKLHKYTYFFANLSYLEFLSLYFEKERIMALETEVGLRPIVTGARGAIFTMMQELGRRVNDLRKYAKGNYFPQSDEDGAKLKIRLCLDDLERISRTPIRRRDPKVCAQEEEITTLLEACMKEVCRAVKRNQEPELKKCVVDLLKRFIKSYSVYTYNQRHNFEKMLKSFEFSSGTSGSDESENGRHQDFVPRLSRFRITDLVTDFERKASLSNGDDEVKPEPRFVPSISKPKEVPTISEKEFQDAYNRMVDYLIRLMDY